MTKRNQTFCITLSVGQTIRAASSVGGVRQRLNEILLKVVRSTSRSPKVNTRRSLSPEIPTEVPCGAGEICVWCISLQWTWFNRIVDRSFDAILKACRRLTAIGYHRQFLENSLVLRSFSYSPAVTPLNILNLFSKLCQFPRLFYLPSSFVTHFLAWRNVFRFFFYCCVYKVLCSKLHWNRVVSLSAAFLEKNTVVNIFRAFTSVFTRIRHCSLLWARFFQSKFSKMISCKTHLIIMPCLPCVLKVSFPSCFCD